MKIIFSKKKYSAAKLTKEILKALPSLEKKPGYLGFKLSRENGDLVISWNDRIISLNDFQIDVINNIVEEHVAEVYQREKTNKEKTSDIEDRLDAIENSILSLTETFEGILALNIESRLIQSEQKIEVLEEQINDFNTSISDIGKLRDDLETIKDSLGK